MTKAKILSQAKNDDFHNKNNALDDALNNRDRAKAEKLYAELKSRLTQGDRLEVEKQIAKMPKTKEKQLRASLKSAVS